MSQSRLQQGSPDGLLNRSWMVAGQFFSDHVVGTKGSGETALGWAVFMDGLEQYWQLARDPSSWHSARFLAEESWIFADDPCYPLSFINLCAIFNLKPEEVRRVLVAWKHAHATDHGRVGPQQ